MSIYYYVKRVQTIIFFSLLAAWLLPSSPEAEKPLVEISEVKPMSPYEKVIDRLAILKKSGMVRVFNIGYSTKGRPIPMVVMSPVTQPELPKIRILIICAQHGDEPASTEAILDIMGRCALRKEPRSLISSARAKMQASLGHLDDVLWMIVPVANPDGYDIGSRLNGAGVDLNRDWVSASQPETQAIRRVYETWRPQVVMDLHQWSRDDPPPAENGLEMMSRPDAPLLEKVERSLAKLALEPYRRRANRSNVGADSLGTPALVTSRPDASRALAHRYFAGRGSVSFLIETAANATHRERKNMLTDLTLFLSNGAGALGSAIPQKAQKFRYSLAFRNWFESRPDYPGLDSRADSKADGAIWIVLGLWILLVGIRWNQSQPWNPPNLITARRQPHRYLRQPMPGTRDYFRKTLISHAFGPPKKRSDEPAKRKAYHGPSPSIWNI